jgi:hypothetical protein
VGIASSDTDPAAVQARYSAQMQGDAADPKPGAPADAKSRTEAPAKQLTADERKAQCEEARKKYQSYMDAMRIYEQGPNGERRYLAGDELDALRMEAKQSMDKLCVDQ